MEPQELHPAARRARACEQDALRLPVWGLQSADNANFRGIECIFIPKGSPFAAAAALVVALLRSMGRNLGGRAADADGEGGRGMASRWLKLLKGSIEFVL